MMYKKNEERINAVKLLLASLGITATPYGNALWLHGNGVSYVVSDLQSVREECLIPFSRTGRIEPECDDNRPLYIGLRSRK